MIRVLPLEPTFIGNSHTATLPLDALAQIEATAKALLRAVEAARGVTEHPSPTFALPTVAQVANEFLLAKNRAGRSDRYLKLCCAHLKAFAQGRANRPLVDISAGEIEAWLHSHGWKPATQRGHLLTIRTLYEFAKDRMMLAGNPALGVDMPTVEPLPPAIHTPAEVQTVLRHAATQDVALCRLMAIRYFAGLRGSEAADLREERIQLDRGFIEVTAASAKTRQRRLVTIQPALRAWLGIGGKLPLTDANTRHWKLAQGCGVKLPQNVTRHSFCSYHLAQFGSAAKTALEAGHTEAMLFRHYREVVTTEAAAEFWQIRPK